MKFSTRSIAPPHPKISGAGGPWPPQGRLAVAVRVSEAGHVPAGLQLRERIDPFLFTAELDAADLYRVADDPGVVSIAPARRIEPTQP